MGFVLDVAGYGTRTVPERDDVRRRLRQLAAELRAWLAAEAGPPPRSWLPAPVARRAAEYQTLPPFPGRFRWPHRE